MCPKAMLRWASDDAVSIYNRTTEQDYTGWVRASAHADIDTIMTHHLPRAEAACDGERARDITYDADEMVGSGLNQQEYTCMLAAAEQYDTEAEI